MRFLPLDRHVGPTLVGALQRRALGSQEPEKNISYETRSPTYTRITNARSRVVMQRCAPRTRPSKDTQRHPFPRHMPPTRFLVHPVQTAILRQALPRNSHLTRDETPWASFCPHNATRRAHRRSDRRCRSRHGKTTNRQNSVDPWRNIRDVEHAPAQPSLSLLSSGQDKNAMIERAKETEPLGYKIQLHSLSQQTHLIVEHQCAVRCKPCKHYHSDIQQNRATSTSQQLRLRDYRMG